MDVEKRAEAARENFLQGYNCAQSVVLAFADLFAERGVDERVALMVASPFGGGMGRMREACGTVSGMFMLLGLMEGYTDPKAFREKKLLYEKVQALAERFREENGSIVCRDLLGLGKGPDVPTPSERTQAYYRKRPCPELCACAARILAEHLAEVEGL